jgi:hypothetical protein
MALPPEQRVRTPPAIASYVVAAWALHAIEATWDVAAVALVNSEQLQLGEWRMSPLYLDVSPRSRMKVDAVT